MTLYLYIILALTWYLMLPDCTWRHKSFSQPDYLPLFYRGIHICNWRWRFACTYILLTISVTIRIKPTILNWLQRHTNLKKALCIWKYGTISLRILARWKRIWILQTSITLQFWADRQKRSKTPKIFKNSSFNLKIDLHSAQKIRDHLFFS